MLDEDSSEHQRVAEWLERYRRQPADSGPDLLVTTNYVVVETTALVRRRIGRPAVRGLFDGFIPSLSVFFVDRELHDAGTRSFLAAARKPSLVDHVSFQFMRAEGIRRAFTLDGDFRREGFEVVP